MNRVLEKNPNTPQYWEKVYLEEVGTKKQRVDDARFGQLMRWMGFRSAEIGGKPSLLDAGCGLADVAQLARDRGLLDRFSYTGLDLSAATLGMARLKLEAHPVVFQAGGVEKIPFPDEAFDIAWCGETLEHVDDPDSAVRELGRVTKESGLVAISIPYRHRNTSPEHVWEFTPEDVFRWGVIVGEVQYLECLLLPSYLTMFGVFRKAWRHILS